MTEIIPNVSGMNFIAVNAFHIEKSPQYAVVGENVRSVEFVRVMNNKLIFVEAKTTFANPENNDNQYKEEIDEICEKFIHSLNLYSSIVVGITDESFPNDFKPENKMSLVFIVVIKSHKSEWCRPIKMKIMSLLPSHLTAIWKPTVYVVNHQTAINKKISVI
jgi:hypothetical protein